MLPLPYHSLNIRSFVYLHHWESYNIMSYLFFIMYFAETSFIGRCYMYHCFACLIVWCFSYCFMRYHVFSCTFIWSFITIICHTHTVSNIAMSYLYVAMQCHVLLFIIWQFTVAARCTPCWKGFAHVCTYTFGACVQMQGCIPLYFLRLQLHAVSGSCGCCTSGTLNFIGWVRSAPTLR